MFSEKIKLSGFLKVMGVLGLGFYGSNALANAAPNFAGIGVGTGTSEYKDYSGDAVPLPIVNLNYEYLYIHGLSVGTHIYQDNMNEVNVALSYYLKEFDASDSSDLRLQQLDDRHGTGMLDFSYRMSLPGQGGAVTFKTSFDVFDETDGGYLFDVNYGNRLSLTNAISVTPGVGFTWSNDKLNEHYYGISAKEASASSLGEYHPDSSISTYLTLGINVALSENFSLFANGKYTFLSDEVTDSPMVENDTTASATVGVSFGL